MQLQTESALSLMESEVMGLSYALHSTTPTLCLLNKLKWNKFEVPQTHPKVLCKVFEIDRLPKVRPQTKHLNIKLHHFHDYVEHVEISIHPISINDQLANILTKPVNQVILEHRRTVTMGWSTALLEGV
jgi:hypothetical protein